jgi:hypothetical protein
MTVLLPRPHPWLVGAAVRAEATLHAIVVGGDAHPLDRDMVARRPARRSPALPVGFQNGGVGG